MKKRIIQLIARIKEYVVKDRKRMILTGVGFIWVIGSIVIVSVLLNGNKTSSADYTLSVKRTNSYSESIQSNDGKSKVKDNSSNTSFENSTSFQNETKSESNSETQVNSHNTTESYNRQSNSSNSKNVLNSNGRSDYSASSTSKQPAPTSKPEPDTQPNPEPEPQPEPEPSKPTFHANNVLNGVINRVSGFMTYTDISEFGGSNFYIDHYATTLTEDQIISKLVDGFRFENSTGSTYFAIEYLGCNTDYSSQPHYVFRCYRA